MKKKNNIFKKLLSLLLVAIITMSAIPFTGVQTSAASSKEEAFVEKIEYLKKKYPTGTYWSTKNGTERIGGEIVAKAGKTSCGGKACGQFPAECYQCFGFANLMAYYTMGSIPTKNVYPSGVNTKKLWQYLNKNSVKKSKNFYAGDVVRLYAAKYPPGHSIFIYKVLNGYAYYVECNANGKCDINWKGKIKISDLFEITYFVVRMKGNTLTGVVGNNNYNIYSTVTKSVTNSTANVSVTLNKSASISNVSYFISKNKSNISNLDATLSSNHKSTSTMDCIRIKNYSPAVVKASDDFVINKFQGKNLTPNTTYYYRAAVKIGGNWYQSVVKTFKTSADKPAAPTLRVASGSEKIGIDGRATLLWDGVKGAESYTITLKKPDGMVYQTKEDIVGTTCVMEGFTEAGVYTVTITAVNGAGSTIGNTVEITVMDDVTVTFFDTISEDVIATDIVHYGESASAPKNPVQQGHTFSKWDTDFENVTENITVKTIYDKNSYTVKFIDSFTNKVLKKQSLKYGDNATAPEVEVPDG